MFCCSLYGLERALNSETTRLELRVNWSKTKLIHVRDALIRRTSSLAEFAMSFAYEDSDGSNIVYFPPEISTRCGLAEDVKRHL